jgi:hypothetical protein
MRKAIVTILVLLCWSTCMASSQTPFVLFMYDSRSEKDLLSTPVGKRKAHRAFWYSLLDLYRQLANDDGWIAR